MQSTLVRSVFNAFDSVRPGPAAPTARATTAWAGQWLAWAGSGVMGGIGSVAQRSRFGSGTLPVEFPFHADA
jgi:glutathione S-transferase